MKRRILTPRVWRAFIIAGLTATILVSTSCGSGSPGGSLGSGGSGGPGGGGNGGSGGGGTPLPPPAPGTPKVRFVTTGGGLFQGVFLSSLQLVFATNTFLNEVDAISTVDMSIKARIPVAKPYGIDASPDGKRVYVGTSAQTLAVIDPYKLRVIENFVPPNSQASWFPLCLGNKVLLTAQQPNVAPDLLSRGGQLIIWDPSSNTFEDITGLFPATGLVSRSGDGSKLLVADNTTRSTVSIYNVNTGEVTQANEQLPANALVAVAMNSNGTQSVVTEGHQLFFYDQNLKQINTISVNVAVGYWGMGYTPDDRYLYAQWTGGGTPRVLVVDTTNFQIAGFIPAAFSPNDPIPLTLDQSGNLLVAANGGMGMVPFQPSLTLGEGPFFPTFARWNPGEVSPGQSVPTQVNSTGFEHGMQVYFGLMGVSTISVVTGSYGPLTVQAPALSTPGPVNTVLQFPDGWFNLLPDAFSYGPTALQLTPTGGPAAGGNQVVLYGYGFNYSPSQLQITVGGKSAAISSSGATNISDTFPIDLATFTIPAGNPGFADVTLTTPTGRVTLHDGYEYLETATVVPATSNLTQIIFDPKRNLVYASAGSKIAVFSPQTMKFLLPFQPPGGALNAQYEGLALTPDSSLLVATDGANHSVAILNPDTPSQGRTVVLSNPSSTTCLPPSNSILEPNEVATTSTGKVFIEQVGVSSTIELDLASGQFLYRCDALSQSAIAGSADGSKIAFAALGSYPTKVAVWDAATDSFTSNPILSFLGDIGISADGTRIVATDADQVDPFNFSYLMDSSLRLANYTYYPDLAPPQGRWVPGIKLNSTGSLYILPRLQGVDILDAQTGALREQIVTPEPLLTPQNVANVLNGLALDEKDQRIFAISASGLTVLQLATFPLGIGSVEPVVGPAAGSVAVTVHGSGFQQGAQITFGSQVVTTIFVDDNTLRFTSPPSISGPVRISVTNPDGGLYFIDAAFVAQ
jgi:hypothetical protein